MVFVHFVVERGRVIGAYVDVCCPERRVVGCDAPEILGIILSKAREEIPLSKMHLARHKRSSSLNTAHDELLEVGDGTVR